MHNKLQYIFLILIYMRLFLFEYLEKKKFFSIKFPERTDTPNNEHEVRSAPIEQLWLYMNIADWSGYYLGSKKLEPVSRRLFNNVRWEFVGKLGNAEFLDGFCNMVEVGWYIWFDVLFFMLMLFCFSQALNREHRGNHISL